MTSLTSVAWPSLPYDGWWNHTYATLHMWMQVVGKIALAQAPPIRRPFQQATGSQ
jgi:hypothetical protein